jgi:peptidyl-tRNA hydrolase, PTH1 family
VRWFRRGDDASSLDLLVVGLGNPGRGHAGNRHNVGWMVVDELARRHGTTFRGKYSGQFAETRVGDAKLALLKPETYMNLSGRSVAPAVRFYKVPPERVLVVHDEGDFDLGRLQARVGGGLAGHNGLRSIAESLGTQEFARLRIGVGRPERGDRRTLADFVLDDFEPHEDPAAIVTRAADAIEVFVTEGLEAAQRRANAATR